MEGTLRGGCAVGIDPLSKKFADYLTAEMFANVVNRYPGLHLTLFMTSCHSGHWIEYPHFNLTKPPAILAGAYPTQMTMAWCMSHSQRHCGGYWTSAALDELLKESTTGPPAEQALPRSLDGIADQATSREYIQMMLRMVSSVRKLFDPERNLEDGCTPLFDEHDIEQRFYSRAGFPLTVYRSRYGQLRVVPASDRKPQEDMMAPPPGYNWMNGVNNKTSGSPTGKSGTRRSVQSSWRKMRRVIIYKLARLRLP